MVEGEQVEFECKASGHPYPSRYFWTINGIADPMSTSPTKNIMVSSVCDFEKFTFDQK